MGLLISTLNCLLLLHDPVCLDLDRAADRRLLAQSKLSWLQVAVNLFRRHLPSREAKRDRLP